MSVNEWYISLSFRTQIESTSEYVRAAVTCRITERSPQINRREHTLVHLDINTRLTVSTLYRILSLNHTTVSCTSVCLGHGHKVNVACTAPSLFVSYLSAFVPGVSKVAIYKRSRWLDLFRKSSASVE